MTVIAPKSTAATITNISRFLDDGSAAKQLAIEALVSSVEYLIDTASDEGQPDPQTYHEMAEYMDDTKRVALENLRYRLDALYADVALHIGLCSVRVKSVELNSTGIVDAVVEIS